MAAPSQSYTVHPDMLVEWDSKTEQAHRRYRRKASTIHGWIVKMRGTLLGSESTRRAGMREMRQAAAIRRYKKDHPEQFRGRPKGNVFWIFPRRSTRSRSRSHRDHNRDRRDDRPHRSHSRRDDRHRERHDPRGRPYYGEREYGPCLHFHHRAKPHHHGHGTYLVGLLTGRHHVREKGREMRERAEKDRRKERRRRKRQRRAEAGAIKLDGTLNKNRWWHR